MQLAFYTPQDLQDANILPDDFPTPPPKGAPFEARIVGEGDGAWKPALGKPVRMRIERKGDGLRVLAGGARIWEGKDDLYGEGQVVFYADSRCRIDHLTFTWTAGAK